MLEKVKKALRITHNQLDDEIQDLIDACKQDLSIGGVGKIVETDALIIQACKVYAKAYSGFFNSDTDKYQQSYEMLKTSLALSGEYSGDDNE